MNGHLLILIFTLVLVFPKAQAAQNPRLKYELPTKERPSTNNNKFDKSPEDSVDIDNKMKSEPRRYNKTASQNIFDILLAAGPTTTTSPFEVFGTLKAEFNFPSSNSSSWTASTELNFNGQGAISVDKRYKFFAREWVWFSDFGLRININPKQELSNFINKDAFAVQLGGGIELPGHHNHRWVVEAALIKSLNDTQIGLYFGYALPL